MLSPQVMDVECEYPDLCRRQPLFPGRHMTPSPAMHGGDDDVQVAAIEPVCIRQVGGTHIRISFTILAMTRRACREKDLASRFDAPYVFRCRVSRMSQ